MKLWKSSQKNKQLKNENRLKEMVIENLESEKFIMNENIQILQNELSKAEIIKQGLHKKLKNIKLKLMN